MMFAANVILCLAGSVTVQDYPSPMGVEHVRISRAQFQDHIESLPLDAPRLEEARAAFAGYTGDFEELIKAFKLAYLWTDSVSALPYDAQDDELYQLIEDEQALLEQHWQRSVRELSDTYFDRLQSLAPPYEDVINRHRRDHLVKRALGQLIEYVGNTIFSETVATDLDLVAVARSNGLDESTAGSLAEYKRQFVVLVQQIDDYIWRHRYERRLAARAAREARLHGTPEEHAQALIEYANRGGAGLRLAWKVRQLNLKYSEQIESQIPESARFQFRTEVERALHPYMFVQTIHSMVSDIDEALGGKGLTDEQNAQLRDLRVLIDAQRAEQRLTLASLYEPTVDPERSRRDYLAGIRTLLFPRGSAERQAALDRASMFDRESEAIQQSFDKAVAAWQTRLEEFDRQLRAIIGEAEDEE